MIISDDWKVVGGKKFRTHGHSALRSTMRQGKVQATRPRVSKNPLWTQGLRTQGLRTQGLRTQALLGLQLRALRGHNLFLRATAVLAQSQNLALIFLEAGCLRCFAPSLNTLVLPTKPSAARRDVQLFP